MGSPNNDPVMSATPGQHAESVASLDRLAKAVSKVWETHGHTEWCPLFTEPGAACECGMHELVEALGAYLDGGSDV